MFRPISSPKSVADLPWMKVVNLNTLLSNKDLRSEKYRSKSYLAGFLSDLLLKISFSIIYIYIIVIKDLIFYYLRLRGKNLGYNIYTFSLLF